jgi:beta-fructofuranosidase
MSYLEKGTDMKNRDKSALVFLIVWGLILASFPLWTAELPRRMTSREDRHRPVYHFLPPANWMNDPNGLIFWEGQYHLFYQYNPNGAFWGTMHWGHAASPDMLHWRDLPIAMAPTPGGPDKDGVFSGCAVNHNGVPTLVFTGTNPEVQCLATSRDGLLTWEKFKGNPVISGPPPGLDVTAFRDPCVWQEGNEWLMALGSGIRGIGGAVLLYLSPDLVHWRYLHPLVQGEASKTGMEWECPNFFPLGNKHCLVISPVPFGKSIYFIGRYENRTFIPEKEGVLDAGGHYYAPQAFLDGMKRRIIFGWSWEGRSDKAQRAAGWAGVQSLPRVLTLGPSGELETRPIPELSKLRDQELPVKLPNSISEGETLLDGISGDAVEIQSEIELKNARQAGFMVYASPGRTEKTLVLYDKDHGTLSIDRSQSGQDPESKKERFKGKLELAAGEPLSLRIFLDHSMLEVYANNRCCLTSRIYPSRKDSLGIGLVAQGGTPEFKSLKLWKMKSIW